MCVNMWMKGECVCVIDAAVRRNIAHSSCIQVNHRIIQEHCMHLEQNVISLSKKKRTRLIHTLFHEFFFTALKIKIYNTGVHPKLVVLKF